MIRRSPRAVVLWAAAAVVAVATATVVASDLASLHRRAAGFGPEERVVVATRDLAIGTLLEASDVRTRAVHRSQLPLGALTDLTDARGRVVAVPVLRGNFVVARNLAPRDRSGLDGALPAGTRAIRVDVANAAVARVGSSVDVLASYAADGTRGAQTVVAASGALVLATDHDGSGGTGRSGGGVTLLVETGEAYDLADAQANGVLTIALVPPEEAAHREP
ncbi:MAG: Flp pilus assembly protein CpaB [Acidimicrobiia bacterium]